MLTWLLEQVCKLFSLPVEPPSVAEPEVYVMHASPQIKQLIQRWEGWRATAYKPVPTEKHWTIGWGHYGPDVKPGMTITQEEGVLLFEDDLRKKCEEPLQRLLDGAGVDLHQHEYDALVSFVFNLGAGNLEKSTLWKKIVAGDLTGAADEFPKWRLSGGKVLPGLVKRRDAERRIWLNGDYSV